MKDDKDLEQLLRQALSPEKEPDYWLNQKILKKAKETEIMNKTYRKRMPAVALTAAIVLSVSSLTAVAAWKYLTPDKVAEEAKDQGLAAAFQSEDAISINESQEYGNYRITLLGIVSGENLSQYVTSDDGGNIQNDRTYVVTAIENADGSPRPETNDDRYGEDPFFVSPLIKGKNPDFFNAVTMNGGYGEFVQDGVQYRITETDNVEIFADQTLYLAVNSGNFYDGNAYQFEESTGEITRNEEYDGVNALFRLPLDETKADKEKAAAYLEQLEKELKGETSDTEELEQEKNVGEETGRINQLTEKIQGWTEEELNQNAQLLETLTQTLTPDEEGCITYSYEMESGMGSSATIPVESIFEKGQTGMSKYMNISDGGEEGQIYVETFTRNEDGTVILKIYQVKDEPSLAESK